MIRGTSERIVFSRSLWWLVGGWAVERASERVDAWMHVQSVVVEVEEVEEVGVVVVVVGAVTVCRRWYNARKQLRIPLEESQVMRLGVRTAVDARLNDGKAERRVERWQWLRLATQVERAQGHRRWVRVEGCRGCRWCCGCLDVSWYVASGKERTETEGDKNSRV